MGDHGAQLTDGAHALKFAQPLARLFLRLLQPVAFGKARAQLPGAAAHQNSQPDFIEQQKQDDGGRDDHILLVARPKCTKGAVVEVGPRAEMKFFLQPAQGMKVACDLPTVVGIGREVRQDGQSELPRALRVGIGQHRGHHVGVQTRRVQTGQCVIGLWGDHAQRAFSDQTIGLRLFQKTGADDAGIVGTREDGGDDVGKSVAQKVDAGKIIGCLRRAQVEFVAKRQPPVDRIGQRRGDLLALEIGQCGYVGAFGTNDHRGADRARGVPCQGALAGGDGVNAEFVHQRDRDRSRRDEEVRMVPHKVVFSGQRRHLHDANLVLGMGFLNGFHHRLNGGGKKTRFRRLDVADQNVFGSRDIAQQKACQKDEFSQQHHVVDPREKPW